MHIEFRISEDDYVSAKDLAAKTRRPNSNLRLNVLRGIGVVCIAASIIPVITIQSVALSLILLFYGLLLLSIPPIRRNRIRRQYRANPLYLEGRTLDVDEGHLRWKTESTESASKWSVYSKFAENEKAFILFTQGNRVFIPISKRELSEEEITGLRLLFETHLPKT